MNNYSFLDATGNVNMPRSGPSPSPSPPASQLNGGGAQQNGIPLVNGLPSGGQQTDMNHLWTVVQQLSQMLEENKAQTQGIVNGVQAIQARAADEGGAERLGVREVNGELNGMSPSTFPSPSPSIPLTRTPPLTASAAASRAAEITALQNQLSSAQQNISSLSASHSSLQSLITDYENALTLLLDKLRPYAYNQTSSILALHKHYQALLEQERSTSMQMRLEHAEWQAGLGRVADYARQALKVQGQREEPLQREIKELKEENRVLRRLAGWEEKDDSSEDEDDKA
jgi:hypothetical protein